jgi:hypothetical protein
MSQQLDAVPIELHLFSPFQSDPHIELLTAITHYHVTGVRRRHYVLLHGEDDFQCGWNPSRLTKEQATKLLTILRQQYADPTGLELLRELEKRKRHAECLLTF